MARRYYSSTAARTTLASGVNDSTTTFTVAAVSGWPSSFPYTLIIDQDTINEEIVEVTARSGTTLTVTRGVDGTTGVAHDAGAAVNHGVSARDFDEPNDHVNDGTTDVHPQYLLESAAATTYVSQAGGSTVTASGASVVPLTLKGASGQTANLLTVEDSAGTDLVVVKSTGRLGLGISSPATTIDIRGNNFNTIQTITSSDTASNAPQLVLAKTRGSTSSPTVVSSNDAAGYIVFRINDGSVNRSCANISAFADGGVSASDVPGRLVFSTVPGGSTTVTERMRINNAGAVMIGTTTPGSASTGDLVVNGGVFLGGSAAANELDDYEEGTWTPTYEPQTNSFTSITYDENSGAYIKIGSLVYIQFNIAISAITVGTATGDLFIGGLPFTTANVSGLADYSAVTFGSIENFTTHPVAGRVERLDTKILLRKRTSSTSALVDFQVSDINTGSTNRLIGSATYYAA